MKQSSTSTNLSENRRKIQKIPYYTVFVWIRATAAIMPAESANCTQSSAGCNTAERKNGGNISKCFYHLRSLYLPRPIQPEHIKPNIIWCKGTFKHRISRPDHIFLQKSHVTVYQVLNMDYKKTEEKNLSFLCTINHLLSSWFFPSVTLILAAI